MGRVAELLGLPQATKAALTADEIDEAMIKGSLRTQDVDTTTGAPVGLRIDLSMSTSPAEKIAKIQKRFPKGRAAMVGDPRYGQHLTYREDLEDPNERPKTVEDFGRTTWGDLGDVTRDLGQAAVDVAPYALFPELAAAKPIYQAITGFATGAGGHAAMEGIEELRGTQMDSAGTVAGDAAKQGALSGAFDYGLSKVGKLADVARGAGAFDMSEAERSLLQNLDNSPLGEHVSIAPIKGDSPIARRMTMQAKSLSKGAQDRLLAGQQAGTDYLQSMSQSRTPHQIGKPLRTELRRMVNQEESRIMKSVEPYNQAQKISLEQGGKIAQSALSEDFVKNSRGVVASLYKELDDVAAIEKPIFKTNDLKKKAKEIIGKLNDFTVQGQVNVPTPETAALAKVLGAIDSVPNYLGDFNVLKNIRTSLWDTIDNTPWQWNGGKKLALDAYSALTDAMKNPVKAGGKPTNGTQYQFLDKLKEASEAAKERFGVFENAQIRAIMNTDKPVTIARTLAKDGNLTEEVAGVMEKWAPEKFNDVRASIKNFWVTDPANRGKLTEYLANQKALYPEAYKRITGGQADESALVGVAQQLDRVNSPNIMAALDRNTQAGHVVTKLMKDQDQEGIEYLMGLVGGKSSPGGQHLKTGLLEGLLNSVSKEGKSGVVTIDHSKFSAQLRDWQRSGILERVFGKEDIENLFLIKHYTRMFNAVLEDSGTSLTAAGTVKSLLHPSSFAAGAHSIVVSKLMGWAMTSPRARKLLLGRGNVKEPFLSGRITANILAAFNQDMETGDSAFSDFFEAKMQEPLGQADTGQEQPQRQGKRPSDILFGNPGDQQRRGGEANQYVE